MILKCNHYDFKMNYQSLDFAVHQYYLDLNQ